MIRAYATNTYATYRFLPPHRSSSPSFFYSVGPATVSTAFLPLLKTAAHPRIINVSALAGSVSHATSHEKSHGAFWTYGPSKAALNYITGVIGVANPDIRVVSICPGVQWFLHVGEGY